MTNKLILSCEMRTSFHFVLLALEVYLGEGPTSHLSLGHDDTYKPITLLHFSRRIKSSCCSVFFVRSWNHQLLFRHTVTYRDKAGMLIRTLYLNLSNWSMLLHKPYISIALFYNLCLSHSVTFFATLVITGLFYILFESTINKKNNILLKDTLR